MTPSRFHEQRPILHLLVSRSMCLSKWLDHLGWIEAAALGVAVRVYWSRYQQKAGKTEGVKLLVITALDGLTLEIEASLSQEPVAHQSLAETDPGTSLGLQHPRPKSMLSCIPRTRLRAPNTESNTAVVDRTGSHCESR